MLKHIGRHNNRQVLIVFRELPAPQEHMALIVYLDTLPSAHHQAILQVVQSQVGQQSNDFADVLHKHTFKDGINMLTGLHKKGWLKKAQTKQVIVVANQKSQVRLDEINKIVTKLKTGGEGAQEMADLDANAGLYDPANADKIVDVKQFQENKDPLDIMGDYVEEPQGEAFNEPYTPMEIDDNFDMPPQGEAFQETVMDNVQIAAKQLSQADKMEAQIKTLSEEVARLKTEAYDMAPALKPKRKYTKRKKADA